MKMPTTHLSFKLWLDDVRDPPDDSWIIARTFSHAIYFFMVEMIEEMSLDHDLGEEKTGYDFLLYVVEFFYPNKVPIKCHIHSANPVDRINMESVINRYFDGDYQNDS